MYICVCNAVTERDLAKAIDAGATTIKALNRELGVGAECGACVGCAKACLVKQASQQTAVSNVFAISKHQVA